MDKFQSLGEKIKSGGAQMTRMVSVKVQEMKEMLASPTPESRIVDQATSPGLEAPDWGLNLRICSLINGHELSDAEVVKSIKRKVNSGSDVVSVRLSLELLEACAMNCDKVFSEIASQKLLDDLLSRLIENPEADRESQVRAMELIRAWGESEDLNYLPAFRQTYENLKTRMITSEAEDAFGSYADEHPVSPPESYPIPGGEAGGSANETMAQAHSYDVLSQEKKKQILEITRNNIEVFSSLLGSTEPVNVAEDDLTITMLEKCKDGQSLLQRIVQSTSEDEGLLFEALNLNDELHQVILKFEEMRVSTKQLGAEQSNVLKESSSTHTPSSSSPEEPNKSSSEDAHNPPAPETSDAKQVIESSKERNTETTTTQCNPISDGLNAEIVSAKSVPILAGVSEETPANSVSDK